MGDDVDAVIAKIAAERTRFEAFCRALSDEELARAVPQSSWLVRDYISHLATIDGPVRAWFGAMLDGEPTTRTGDDGRTWDVDRFNDAEVAARRERSVEQILAEAAVERALMVEQVRRFTPAHLAASVRFGGDSKRPPSVVMLGQYLRGWARHDVIHVQDMLRALPGRRTDPLVTEWLAEPEVASLLRMYARAMA